MARHIVDCDTLAKHLDEWLVFDCRHDLMDPDKGPKLYAAGHIAGALHAHIDRDLAAPVGDGSDGRHPLPVPSRFVEFLRASGLKSGHQVVVYDDAGGMWAGRMWWLLRYYGHREVAVLDGGFPRWQVLDLPVTTDVPEPEPGDFEGEPGHMPTVDSVALEAQVGQPGARQLVDARAPERYKGEVEPLDPEAGHIPGALNLPFAWNLTGDGRFREAERLQEKFEEALGVQEVGGVVVYCGSGVTAAHDILAMEYAGMGTAALYPASWSGWSHPDAARAIRKGARP